MQPGYSQDTARIQPGYSQDAAKDAARMQPRIQPRYSSYTDDKYWYSMFIVLYQKSESI